MEPVWFKSYPKGMPREVNTEEYLSLPDFFEKCCAKHKNKRAVSNMGTAFTYEELEKKTRDFAAYLQQVLHLNKGDRLAIMLPNCLQYYVALLGALRAGLVVVNVNPLYTKRELVEQLRDAQVDSIVVMANFAHTLETALPELKIKNIILTQLGDLFSFPKSTIVNLVVKYVKKLVQHFRLPHAIPFNTALKEGAHHSLEHVRISGEDLAFLQYTGGTTGVAKGAMLTHRNIISDVYQILAWTDQRLDVGSELTVAPLPLYHIFSLTVCCFVMIGAGAETILITNPRDIPGFIKELKGRKFTIFVSINTLCNGLLNNPEFAKLDFSKFRYTFVGGMAATAGVAKRWKEVTGVHILEGYGLTETSPVVTLNSFHHNAFTGGIGYPLPGTEIDIKDEEGNTVSLNEIGELWVRGPQVMKGYWNNPSETALAMTRDGWFKTGDMVKMDEKGLVTLVERKKDMIIISGFKVFPNEVEDILMSHPGVLEAAVIGVPCVDHGELVKAFIVKKDPDLTREDLIAYCEKNLTRYKIPHEIEFIEQLPKSPVGKILRRLLRKDEKKEKTSKFVKAA